MFIYYMPLQSNLTTFRTLLRRCLRLTKLSRRTCTRSPSAITSRPSRQRLAGVTSSWPSFLVVYLLLHLYQHLLPWTLRRLHLRTQRHLPHRSLRLPDHLPLKQHQLLRRQGARTLRTLYSPVGLPRSLASRPVLDLGLPPALLRLWLRHSARLVRTVVLKSQFTNVCAIPHYTVSTC